MTVTIASQSVVITAKDHNPSILHPEFLTKHAIIDPSWGWKVTGRPISTPALSRVHFDSDFAIICDPNRLQFIDNNYPLTSQSPHLFEVATRYAQTLPHTPYTAVGVNLSALLPHNDPGAAITHKYISDGPWLQEPSTPTAGGLRLVYKLDDWKLRVSIDAGEFERPGDQSPTQSIIIQGNFHQDCERENSAEDIVNIIHEGVECWAMFDNLVQILCKNGGNT